MPARAIYGAPATICERCRIAEVSTALRCAGDAATLSICSLCDAELTHEAVVEFVTRLDKVDPAELRRAATLAGAGALVMSVAHAGIRRHVDTRGSRRSARVPAREVRKPRREMVCDCLTRARCRAEILQLTSRRNSSF